ncbi:MAG: glycosyltransferase family 2 protein [Candidatus Eisenbacteria bacterium]
MNDASEGIVVLVPAFNEEATVRAVVEEVRAALPRAAVVVVNDGSSDRTGEEARAGGAVVVDLPFNLGIGAAMQTGYRYARAKGYRAAVQVDGDGQHVASEIPALLQGLEEGADLVVGSRFGDRGSYRAPALRGLGIAFFGATVSLLTRKRFRDTTSGFRAANRRVIEYFARHYPSDYPEPEAILLLCRAGFRVRETAARFRERGGGRSSISALGGFFYLFKVFLALVMGALRRPPGAEREN